MLQSVQNVMTITFSRMGSVNNRLLMEESPFQVSSSQAELNALKYKTLACLTNQPPILPYRLPLMEISAGLSLSTALPQILSHSTQIHRLLLSKYAPPALPHSVPTLFHWHCQGQTRAATA